MLVSALTSLSFFIIHLIPMTVIFVNIMGPRPSYISTRFYWAFILFISSFASTTFLIDFYMILNALKR